VRPAWDLDARSECKIGRIILEVKATTLTLSLAPTWFASPTIFTHFSLDVKVLRLHYEFNECAPWELLDEPQGMEWHFLEAVAITSMGPDHPFSWVA
jgi:hypothetical protein